MNRSIRLLSGLLFLSCSIALNGCSSTKKSDPYSSMTAEQIYNKGKLEAKKDRYEAAIKSFEALEARYPYGDYTSKAQLALIHAYYKKDEAASALAAADRFIRMHPQYENVDYAYYLKGVVNYEENFSTVYKYFPLDRSFREPTLAKQSFDDFKILLQKFPTSKYAVDAQNRMINLRNQLAKHELHVADYYMRKKAYLAAANRAAYVVNQFDQTEVIPNALTIMVKAYRALGMHELANDALVTLNNNFPHYEKLLKEVS
jgi:outer membrane protein assembly factor BamD